jgi:NAD(P)-dependent dehydrogenase (short-subunit alcohol dehydrogenase family)
MTNLPPHFGYDFTPTIHTSTIPSNLSSLSLPSPFIVVVTGAGKGLGYHISLAYARAGCTGIAISSRTLSDLDLLEAEISKVGKGVEVLKTVCDVQDDESVKELEKSVRKKWGRVDLVIANAGIISQYVEKTRKSGEGKGPESNLPIGIVEDGDWMRVLDINVNGVWRISTRFFSIPTPFFSFLFFFSLRLRGEC